MYYDEVMKAAKYIRQHTVQSLDVGVILGSGLGALVERMSGADTIAYADIPGFPVSDVEGHAAQLGIACITNMATGIAKTAHSHEEVLKTAGESSERLCLLIETMLEKYYPAVPPK